MQPDSQRKPDEKVPKTGGGPGFSPDLPEIGKGLDESLEGKPMTKQPEPEIIPDEQIPPL